MSRVERALCTDREILFARQTRIADNEGMVSDPELDAPPTAPANQAESADLHSEAGSIPAVPLNPEQESNSGKPAGNPAGEFSGESGGGPLAFLLVGVHFGVLQAALFFVAQVYVTATFFGYFIVVMAWMGGTILALKTGYPRSLTAALGLSALAYFLLLFLGSTLVPGPIWYPLYFLLAMIAALPAGAFFRVFARTVSTRSLFLHENNGFVLGLLLGMFGFVQWGVDFLSLAPIVSLGAAILGFARPLITLLVILPTLAFVCHRMENDWAAWTLVVALGLGVITWLIPHLANLGLLRAETDESTSAKNRSSSPLHLPFPYLFLALAGINLILLQYFITREFSSILAASELAILVVGVAYFSGFSVGYLISRAIPGWALRWGAVGMFLLHLATLLFVKVTAGILIDSGYGFPTLIALLFLAAFCTSSFYSILLPRVIDSLDLSLIRGYTWDLAGAIGGVVLMLFLVPLAPWILWPFYFTVLLIIVLFLHWDSPWRPVLGLWGLGIIGVLFVYQPSLQRYATEDYYRTRSSSYTNPKILFSGNSFYHSIDVIETYGDSGEAGPESRVSFINGVRYFRHRFNSSSSNEASLSEFTYFLAELPAHYLHEQLGRPLRILIMGGGSLSTLSRVAPYAERTTLVEIDALVVESAKACWSDMNRWEELDNYEIVIDDARHYLRTTEEKFDLIINDVSAPYYLGTAIMHSKELYELVKSRLKPDGLFAESTQGRPIPSGTTSQAMKILRGVADVFPHWRVVDCEKSPRGKRGFVYATAEVDPHSPLKLATADLTAIMKQDEKYRGTDTYWEGTDHFRLHRVQPFSLHNMETLLTSNINRIKRRMRINRRTRGQTPSLAAVLGSTLDRTNPEHSRLFVSIWGNIQSPRSIQIVAFGLLLTIALRWGWPLMQRRLFSGQGPT